MGVDRLRKKDYLNIPSALLKKDSVIERNGRLLGFTAKEKGVTIITLSVRVHYKGPKVYQSGQLEGRVIS